MLSDLRAGRCILTATVAPEHAEMRNDRRRQTATIRPVILHDHILQAT